MFDYGLHVAAVTGTLTVGCLSAAGAGEEALSGPALAHLAALRARLSLQSRRVWLLLPRTSWDYGDFVTMPGWMPQVLSRHLPGPDSVSVISDFLHCGFHLRSWHSTESAGQEAWSMLTTSMPQVRARPSVPVWAGDAVVLAGQFTRSQAVEAVELVTLAALAGGRPPVLVVPAATERVRHHVPGAPESGDQLVQHVLAALRDAAARTAGRVTVTTDDTFIGPGEQEELGGLLATCPGRRRPTGHAGAPVMTDAQWEVLGQVLPLEAAGARRAAPTDLRALMTSALWKLRTQQSWAQMPPALGTAAAARRQWRTWETDGVIDQLRTLLDPTSCPARVPA